MIEQAYDAYQTRPEQNTAIPDPRQAQVNLGSQTFQPKPPPKRTERTVTEQMNFNEELLSVLHKELQELFGILQPVMFPAPEESRTEKELSELNSHIVERLIKESDKIQHMIDNIRQAQRDLQL